MSSASDAPHEANFVFPWRDLENDRVKLELFNVRPSVRPHPPPYPHPSLTHPPSPPAVHGPAYWEGTKDHPSLYDYTPWGPFPSLPAFTHYLTQRLASPSSLVLLAAAPAIDIPVVGVSELECVDVLGERVGAEVAAVVGAAPRIEIPPRPRMGTPRPRPATGCATPGLAGKAAVPAGRVGGFAPVVAAPGAVVVGAVAGTPGLTRPGFVGTAAAAEEGPAAG